MPALPSDYRRAAVAAAITGLLAFAAPALAGDQTPLPDVRLTYGDLGIDTAAGRRLLVERVEIAATDHCARYGALIVPYERRLQPRYCVVAVRGEILRALPREVRTAYDLGRRRNGG